MKNDPAESVAQQGLVRQAALYIESARDERPTEPARQAALKCIFDLLGATIVGIADIGPLAIRKASPGIFGSGGVPIWFTGEKGSVIGAAWANSSAAAALDLDDGNRFARGHPGAAVIPTAFAVAHQTGATLEDIVNAIVIGYEVGVEIGAARTTYGSSGTWTSYGVVATAAALRRTPKNVIEHALAIAGESSPIQAFAGGPAPRIPAPEGAAVKEGIPWSVVTGLAALSLAEAGHTGPRNILDSVRHYEFPKDLVFGASQHICSTYFKPYACCRHVHAPLAAMLKLIAQHDIDVDSITGMVVEIHAAGLRISNRTAPSNLIDVQYSIPYCLALAALYGPQTLVPVTSKALEYEGVTTLAETVKLVLSPELDSVYPKDILARVTVLCGDKHYVSAATRPEGEPLMSWEQLEDKFLIATRLVASKSEQVQLLSAMKTARAGDAAALMTCTAGQVVGSANVDVVNK